MFESLYNKVTDLEACKFIKKRLQRRCFSVNIAKFFRAARTPLVTTSGTSVAKMLKLKVRKFWGLIPPFVEITGEKLVGEGLFAPAHHPE